MKAVSKATFPVTGKYSFTADERSLLTEKLVDALAEAEEIEQEFKTVKSQFKNRMDGNALEIKNHSTAVKNGYEMRTYQCTMEKNFDSGYREYFDLITGNLISKEVLTSADYQTRMDEDMEEISKNNAIADQTVSNDFQNNESDQLGMVINMKVAEANADMEVFSEPDPFDEQTAVDPDAPETPVGEEIALDDDPFNMGLKSEAPQIPREETFKPVEPETPAKVKKVKKDEPDVEGFPFD